jgi:hypothetical protein
MDSIQEDVMAMDRPKHAKIVAFDPSRQFIRVGNHEFILDLNLTPDGTGIARVSVIESAGKPRLISSAFKQRPEANWEFAGPGSMPCVDRNLKKAAEAIAMLWVGWQW